mgnify:CR=1 FL=1
MKKLIVLSTALLMALSPMLGSAQAQSRSGDAPQIERQVKKPQATRPQAKKQQWKKGGKYAGKGARVSDHRRHNLKAPPKGHRWVRDGNDFLLVAIGTGIIASIVTGR